MITGSPAPGAHTISVVVNTVDRAAPLQTLLVALEQQRYHAFEVIVVVGPTRDDTLAVLRRYGDRIRVLRCPTANLGRSRNLGILAARGEIVAFIDDDAVPCRTWLAQIAAAFDDPTVAASGGTVYAIHPAQPAVQHRLGVVSNLGEQQNVRDPGEDARPEGRGRFWSERPMGTNMAVRREQLLAVGGFDAFFAWVYDDADIAVRLALAGHTVRLLAEAPVYHVPASSRNRVVRTFHGRWWVGVQAATYFAVRNGRAARQPARAIVRRLAHVLLGEWRAGSNLRRTGRISLGDLWVRRARAVAAGLHGTLAALGGTRRLLTHQELAHAEANPAPLRPYLRPSSLLQPAVDPIDGYQAAAPLPAAPLAIALVTPAFPAPEQPCTPGRPGYAACALAHALQAAGHTVHVVVPGTDDELTFHHGAYVHRVAIREGDPPAADPCFAPAVLAALQRIQRNDAIEVVDWVVDTGPGVDPVTGETALAPADVAALVDAYRRCIIERSTDAAGPAGLRLDERR